MGRESFSMHPRNREIVSMEPRNLDDFRTFTKCFIGLDRGNNVIITMHQTKETSLATHLERHQSGHYHKPIHLSHGRSKFVPVSEINYPNEELVKRILVEMIDPHYNITPGIVNNPDEIDPQILKLLPFLNFADFFKQFKEKRLSEFNRQKSNQDLITHLIELKLLTPANFYDFFRQLKTMKLSDIQTENLDQDLISFLIKMGEYCEFVELNFPLGIPTGVYQSQTIKIADQRLMQLSLAAPNKSFIIPPFQMSKSDYLRYYGLKT